MRHEKQVKEAQKVASKLLDNLEWRNRGELPEVRKFKQRIDQLLNKIEAQVKALKDENEGLREEVERLANVDYPHWNSLTEAQKDEAIRKA